MKSILTISFLYSSTVTAFYAANAACHSNIECNNNCYKSQFTIGNQNGQYVFVCDPVTSDPPQSYLAQCNRVLGVVAIPDTTITAAACKDLGGKFCQPDCVLSGKGSVEQQTRDAWGAACTKAGGQLGDFDVYEGTKVPTGLGCIS